MTTTLFEFPKNANFGRVLPKNKIYGHAQPTKAIKELFVRQVEQIVWQYKLAPETINVKGTPAVPEIQVFSVVLKDGELNMEVLRCIDQAISLPIIFELRFEERVKLVAAFKRLSESDSTKWEISEYFSGDWVSVDTPRKLLPMVFDLEQLYSFLLSSLIPHSARAGEKLQMLVERAELIQYRLRELERCQTRLRKEKQFNRKVAINAELRDLKQELERLTR
jgi:hypothetical protein